MTLLHAEALDPELQAQVYELREKRKADRAPSPGAGQKTIRPITPAHTPRNPQNGQLDALNLYQKPSQALGRNTHASAAPVGSGHVTVTTMQLLGLSALGGLVTATTLLFAHVLAARGGGKSSSNSTSKVQQPPTRIQQ